MAGLGRAWQGTARNVAGQGAAWHGTARLGMERGGNRKTKKSRHDAGVRRDGSPLGAGKRGGAEQIVIAGQDR